MSLQIGIEHPAVPSFDVLGCEVHATTALELTDLLEYEVNLGKRCVIANHNLHSLYLYQKDEKLRRFFTKSKWTHADGMAIVLLARMTGSGLNRSDRVTYVDWMPLIMERAATHDWRVFYLGSKPGVAEKGIKILQERFPGLQMKATHGYFDPASEENDRVLDEIRNYSPQVLMVGMGMPRQEQWIVDNLEKLGPMVILPCGASIDYVAGEIPTPPRWAGRFGLEWLYRLIAEPRRLWTRYLVEPWALLLLVGTRWLRSR